MVNKIPKKKSTAEKADAPPDKYPIPATPNATPEMQEYFENRVRKTLRLNVVALRLSNLLKP